MRTGLECRQLLFALGRLFAGSVTWKLPVQRRNCLHLTKSMNAMIWRGLLGYKYTQKIQIGGS